MRRVIWSLALLLSGLLALASTLSAMLPTPADIQWSHPLARGLIHWWYAAPPLMGGGRWWPFVGQIPGTLTNIGTTGGWYRSDRPGWLAAMYLDGVDDSIVMDAPTAFDFANQSFTIGLRFKVSSCTSTTYLVSKTQPGFAGGWFLRLSSPGILRARIYSNGGECAGRETVANTTLCNGALYSVVVAFTTDTVTAATNDVTIYLNGVADNSARGFDGGAYSPYPAAPLTLGSAAVNPSIFMPGSLDDIRIWNRALTASEALQWHRSLPPTFDDLLVPPALNQVMFGPGVKRRITIQ